MTRPFSRSLFGAVTRLGLAGQSLRLQTLTVLVEGVLVLRIVAHRLVRVGGLERLVGFTLGAIRGLMSQHIDLV
ncbi:hypothetical protein BJA5080_00402 [Bradyrhizobium diazoefficiens SEMIA 5080]|uniref:Uncharacterized protein n=1 Tax=Bradyrhizobium diazoefficiens SEMIA 5080 TaxID=754504 RepID=A0A837CI82_9BRAD|nr:hypothetical protein BJA5080_00402 [Bradyrhizobium diazoefficiens SEMIA 5080]